MAEPDVLPSSTSALPFVWSMSAQMTLAPSRTSCITVALPMPEAPPVTSAVMPTNSMFSSSAFRWSEPSAVEKGLDAFSRLGVGLKTISCFEFIAEAATPGFARRGDAELGRRERRARQGCNAPRNVGGARSELRFRTAPLHNAEPFGHCAIDGLGREDHAVGEAAADQPRQPLRTAGSGNESELNLRQADLGLGRRNP